MHIDRFSIKNFNFFLEKSLSKKASSNSSQQAYFTSHIERIVELTYSCKKEFRKYVIKKR